MENKRLYIPVSNSDPDSTNVGISIAEFMLTPSIPESEQEKFKDFSIMYCNIMALGYIERHERFAMICTFEEICILLEWGAYDRAHQLMAQELMLMQSSRSVNAVNLRYGLRGVDRKEIVESGGVGTVSQKKSLTNRITGAIKPTHQEFEI